jgi:hypothetical protein
MAYMKRLGVRSTHPLLKDPEAFRRAVIRTVASSTAIETGENVATLERAMSRRRGKRSGPVKPKR